MGVSAVVNRMTYNGDNTTTTFAFPYYFFNQTDLEVFIYDTSLDTITQKTLNTDYTISGTVKNSVYPSGGSIVFGSAPTNTQVVVIVRNPSQVQNYTLLQTGQISSLPLVQQFDYLTLLVQRLEDQVSRCLQIPDGYGASFGVTLPANLASQPGKAIVVKDDASGITLEGFDQGRNLEIDYTNVDVAVPDMSAAVLMFNLPPGAILNFVAAQHTTSFKGGTIGDVYISIGTQASPNLFVERFDVFQNPGSGVFANAQLSFIGDFETETGIYVTFYSTVENLNDLTQGVLQTYWGYTSLI